jgi:hypothetical protein
MSTFKLTLPTEGCDILRHMLRPWVDHPSDFEPDPDPDADLYVNWTVFGRQLGSWREFIIEVDADYSPNLIVEILKILLSLVLDITLWLGPSQFYE